MNKLFKFSEAEVLSILMDYLKNNDLYEPTRTYQVDFIIENGELKSALIEGAI